MARFRLITPFNVPMLLLIPSDEMVKGVKKKTYPDIAAGIPFNASFRTFGGTELQENGVYVTRDTATVQTWYRPDIKAGCRVAVAGTDEVYEIIGTPENINRRNQWLQFKIERLAGGA